MSVEEAMRGVRSAELAPGTTFAGYRIERTLGRGGMGVVYLATELKLERPVALKVIRGEIADDERFHERFRIESRTAASIEDPRVVTVFAAGEQDGLAYVAMRYVPGLDLQRWVARRGPLSPVAAAAVIAQVANGLDAVHAAGLVHRDVKPANVILAEDGGVRDDPRAYLTDFGLAKAVASTSGLTATGEVIGTVDYMAPEQIEAGRVDARADVYALGGVLFHAITGEVPYSDRESTAKMWAHLNEPPPSARSRGGAGVLDAVIRRAMAKDPTDRYPSTGDLGRAAMAAVRGEAVTEPEHAVGAGEAAPTEPTAPVATPFEPPTEAIPKRRRRRKRRRGFRIAAALLLVGLAVVGAAAFVAVPELSDGDTPPAEQREQSRPSGVTVPFLIGLPLDEAESELDALGLESDWVGGGLFGILVPEDWEVCDTAPAPDEVVSPGSTVELLVERPGSC